MSRVEDRAAAYFGFTNDPGATIIKIGRRSVAIVHRRKGPAVLGLYKEDGAGRIKAEFLWLDNDKRQALAEALNGR